MAFQRVYEDRDLPGLCAGDPHLGWLPEDAFEVLPACFQIRAQRLPAGEAADTAGRIGYLLRGSAACGGRVLSPGTLAGVRRGGDGRPAPAAERLTAREDCVILWLEFQVLRSVCYRACWFHVRLLQVLDSLPMAGEAPGGQQI